VTFTTAALGQLRLNSIDEKLFPIPKYSLTPKRDLKGMGFTFSCRHSADFSLHSSYTWSPFEHPTHVL